jgi:hypothetical protein
VARTRRAASLIGCPSATSSTASIRRYSRASRATDNARSRRRRSVEENCCTADFACPRMPASVTAKSDWSKTSGYLLSASLLKWEIEVDRHPCSDGLKQGCEFGRWRRLRPGLPAACEPVARCQPGSHGSQRLRPGEGVLRADIVSPLRYRRRAQASIRGEQGAARPSVLRARPATSRS